MNGPFFSTDHWGESYGEDEDKDDDEFLPEETITNTSEDDEYDDQ